MFGFRETPKTKAGRVGETVAEGVTLALAAPVLVLATKALFDMAGLDDWNTGNANSTALEKAFAEDPLSFTFGATVTGPITEELIFRGIPLGIVALLGLGNKGALATGTTFALAFSLLHNLQEIPGGGLTYVNGFPTSIFVSGLAYWNIARRKNLNHSILAHGTRNATGIGMYALLG